MSLENYTRYIRLVKDRADSLVLAGGMLMANLLDPEALSVHVNTPLIKQAALSISSALPAPDIYPNSPGYLNIPWQVGYSVLSLEFARKTASRKQIGAVALGSQIAASAADYAIGQTGFINAAERAQPNNGASAMAIAILVMSALDRARTASSTRARYLWNIGTLGFVSSMTAGAYLVEGRNGAKLDLVAHSLGAAVGAGGFMWQSHKNKRRQNYKSANPTDLLPAR